MVGLGLIGFGRLGWWLRWGCFSALSAGFLSAMFLTIGTYVTFMMMVNVAGTITDAGCRNQALFRAMYCSS